MKMTLEFLNEECVYPECIEFIKENEMIGLKEIDSINKFIEYDKIVWANLLVIKFLNKIDRVKYAVYAAEQVIDIYEKEHPNDKRPRKAIEAAKIYINNPNINNNEYSSIINAASNAHNAYTDMYSNNTAPYNVIRAGYAAYSASEAAYTVHGDTKNVEYSAINASVAASDSELLIKIIRNGIEILKGEKNENN